MNTDAFSIKNIFLDTKPIVHEIVYEHIRASLLAHGACHEQIHMFHTRLTSESFVQLISPIFPSLVTLSNLHDHSRQTHQTHISELIPITNVKT